MVVRFAEKIVNVKGFRSKGEFRLQVIPGYSLFG